MKTKNIILPWGVHIIFVIIIAVVVGIEFFASFVAKDLIQVATNTTCSPKQLATSWSTSIYLTLDCNGAEYWTDKAPLVLAFVNEHKPAAVCTVYKSGRASCEESP